MPVPILFALEAALVPRSISPPIPEMAKPATPPTIPPKRLEMKSPI